LQANLKISNTHNSTFVGFPFNVAVSFDYDLPHLKAGSRSLKASQIYPYQFSYHATWLHECFHDASNPQVLNV